MNRPWLAPLLILVILAAGSWLRFANLADRPFATDEAVQYYATRSLVESGMPLLPSGVRYTRGIGYSRLSAPLLARSSRPEFAMRLPAAVLGTVALAGFVIIGWALGGPWSALWCGVLLGLYPEAVRLSRFGRFYTLQLALGLVALYAGWRAFRPALPGNPTVWRRQWAWTGLALTAFAAATAVQVTTLSVAFAWLALMGGQAVLDWRRYGTAAWRWSGALQVVALVLAGLTCAVLWTAGLDQLLARASAVPLWARLGATGNEPRTAYYRLLSASWPIGITLLPLAALWLFLRRERLSVFLLGWFGIPLLVHSLLLPWKQERYVLLAIPAWLLLLALATADAATALRRFLVRVLGNDATRQDNLAGALVTLMAVAAVITQPAFNAARRMPATGDADGWLASSAILGTDSSLAAYPVAATSPLPALHYWGRLDFTVQPALRERWSGAGYELAPVGAKDIYAGVPVLPAPADIRAAFPDRAGVVIGIDRKYVTSHNIDPALLDTLEHRATELCQGHCGTMRLYRWRF